MDGPRPRPARFIPFRRHDIVAMCLADGALRGRDAEAFRLTAAKIGGLIHHEFHHKLETLKDAYAPVAADADTRVIEPPIDGERPEGRPGELVKALATVLERANYEAVTRTELHRALTRESLFRVRLFVNYDDFEEVLVFKRGESLRTERVRSWFGLRKRDVAFVNYDRVLLYVRFKDAAHFERRKRRKLPFVPGTVFIKLFRNIPRLDVEMLFPNAEVRMKAADKLAIGVPALLSGALVAATKLGATAVLIGALVAFWIGWRKDEVKLDQAALLGLAAGLFAIGGYFWRQFSNFRNRKIQFLKLLADNLYFKKLDTNAGVFHSLIDAAEEEEAKEALLAYRFLLTADRPLEGHELDERVEAWFRDRWNCRFDFDFNDALARLEHLGLVRREGTAVRAVLLGEALKNLDERWGSLFDTEAHQHVADAEAAPVRRPAVA